MKNLLPLLVVLFMLVAGALAVAIWVVVFRSTWPSQPVGVVLIYEVDPDRTRNPGSVNMRHLVAAIDQRLNAGWHKGARVRELEDGRIEIGISGNDPEVVRRIERIVERQGTVEFRILANRRDHKALIERARSEDASVLRDADGKIQAWWVPVQAGMESSFRDSPEIASRSKGQADREILEVLVVKDLFDVTGAYFTDAVVDWDEAGNPCVLFELDSAGARLFGRLTATNLPDPADGFHRQMGIILDGRLYSAPRIKSAIYDRGVIEGLFTDQEVEDLAAVLNAGSLPTAIRQVEKRIVEPEE